MIIIFLKHSLLANSNVRRWIKSLLPITILSFSSKRSHLKFTHVKMTDVPVRTAYSHRFFLTFHYYNHRHHHRLRRRRRRRRKTPSIVQYEIVSCHHLHYYCLMARYCVCFFAIISYTHSTITFVHYYNHRHRHLLRRRSGRRRWWRRWQRRRTTPSAVQYEIVSCHHLHSCCLIW